MRGVRELSVALAAAFKGAGEPASLAVWTRAFESLSGFAGALLEADAMRNVAVRVATAGAKYMRGIPVHDSVFASWWMADLPVGSMRESMCSILADIGPAMGLEADLIRCARLCAESRMGVYRVSQIGRDRVELDELMTGARVCARLPSDMHARLVGGDLCLTRLLPPLTSQSTDWVAWTAPYRLVGAGADPEAEWIAYCERVTASTVDAKAEPAERLARHFKGADRPQRWLDYIAAGYAGVDERGAIVLTGVPDWPRPWRRVHLPARAG